MQAFWGKLAALCQTRVGKNCAHPAKNGQVGRHVVQGTKAPEDSREVARCEVSATLFCHGCMMLAGMTAT